MKHTLLISEQYKYYTDEHVSKAIVNGLRQRGTDVLTTPEARLLGAGDETHLQRAAAEKRVVFTQDDDFLRLYAAGYEHRGIVLLPNSAPLAMLLEV